MTCQTKDITENKMAEALLITRDDVVKFTAMNGNVDTDNFIQWIDAPRVSQVLDSTGEIVIGYQLEAQRLPDSGVGSLIQFTGIDPDGILNRGGRTIRTAAALERAVFNYAETPAPSVVLKANVPMDSNKATALLSAWKQARQTKGTAFLSDNVDMQQIGFSSADLQMTEAREYLNAVVIRDVSFYCSSE